ncbi:MAG: CRTAC1 family protein [Thermoguttaceae bacterium]
MHGLSRLFAGFAAFTAVLFPSSGDSAEIRFEDVTARAGLLGPLAGMMGHGGAVGDIDGDGDLDLFVGGFCDRPDAMYAPATRPVPNMLFRNRGNGTFEPIASAPAKFLSRTSGAVFADLDNNGTLELYVANNRKNRAGSRTGVQRVATLCPSKLFRNDGKRLIDVSASSGACPPSMGTARNVGVFDYNGDGLLDLLLVEDRFTRDPRSVLLRNLGNLRFEDASRDAGLPDDLFGLGLAVADLNEDGRPDFFVGHSNRFFLSTGDGKYREPPELKRCFAWEPLHNEDWPCGAAFGDLNRDGRLDMVLAIHCVRARNRIFINDGLKRGVPQFRDVTDQVGLPAEVPAKCPHVEIQDFDNDGLPDLYFSAAWLDESGAVTPLVFRNTGLRGGLPRFESPRPVKAPMVYFSTGPSGDFDGDGRIDLFLVNWFQQNHSRLMRNVSPRRHWLDVQVVGSRINRMGIGTQIRVYRPGKVGQTDALLGFQEVSIGYGYAAGQAAVCHFGLGDATTVDVAVKLPDATVLIERSVTVDRRLVIRQP